MRQLEEKIIGKNIFYFIDGSKAPLRLKRETDFSPIVFLLYRFNENISEVDHFINQTLKNYSYDTRRKQARALYLFYIFIEYSKCNIYNLSKDDIINLINFFAGNSNKLDNAILITKRNALSVSGFLSIIRNYLYSLDIKNEYLGNPSSKKSVKTATQLIKQEVEGSLRYGEATNEYITKEEFNRLIELTKHDRDFTSETIIRMQYEYGFRIGEILGLTIEDISEPIQTGPYEYQFSLVLRERKSDKSYQRFRTKFSAAGFKKDHEIQYSDYTVKINFKLYSLLKKYISSTKDSIKLDYCKADNLTHKHQINYYVFISKTGHALSDQMWNQKLREYFERASIITDKDISKSNLNNRLRRGYIATRITELQNQGIHLEEIKRILAYELRYVDTYYLREFIRNFQNPAI